MADNAAVEINFKHPPQDLDDGKLWARIHSGFLHLESAFDGQSQSDQPLKKVSTLTFSYSKPGNSTEDERLTYTTTENGAVVVSVKFDKLKKKDRHKHLLVPANLRGLRLRLVEGEAPDKHFRIELFSGDTPKYERATFTIVAVPHPHP